MHAKVIKEVIYDRIMYVFPCLLLGSSFSYIVITKAKDEDFKISGQSQNYWLFIYDLHDLYVISFMIECCVSSGI